MNSKQAMGLITHPALVWSESILCGKFLAALRAKRPHVKKRHVGHPVFPFLGLLGHPPVAAPSTENSGSCGKVLEQRLAQAFLLLGSEFAPGRGEIKNVDGRLSLCFDQGDVDVAILVRERGADPV